MPTQHLCEFCRCELQPSLAERTPQPCLFGYETESCCVTQAALDLLASRDPPTSDAGGAEDPGVCPCASPCSFMLPPFNPGLAALCSSDPASLLFYPPLHQEVGHVTSPHLASLNLRIKDTHTVCSLTTCLPGTTAGCYCLHLGKHILTNSLSLSLHLPYTSLASPWPPACSRDHRPRLPHPHPMDLT